MDFEWSDDQRAIAELAATILADQCPPERLRRLERDRVPLAADAWAALAAADLLGLALPTRFGGSELGLLEACLVAEQVGRHVAPVPYWPQTAAATTLDRWGSEAQRERWLPGATGGSTPLTVALWEPAAPGMARQPTVRAQRDGQGWRLEGVKQPVPWAGLASAMVIPARVAGNDAGAGADAGLDADDALDVAAFWVADGGQRVVHAAQHLHGGIGVDVDYPLHRYFRWAKVLELLVGGATGSLLRLGASLAAGDPADTGAVAPAPRPAAPELAEPIAP